MLNAAAKRRFFYPVRTAGAKTETQLGRVALDGAVTVVMVVAKIPQSHRYLLLSGQ